jgi:hypothetical protein
MSDVEEVIIEEIADVDQDQLGHGPCKYLHHNGTA